MSPCHKFNKKKDYKTIMALYFFYFSKEVSFFKGFLSRFVKSPHENACSIYTLAAFFLFSLPSLSPLMHKSILEITWKWASRGKRSRKKKSGACQADQLKLASPQEIKEGRGRKEAYLSCHLSLIGDGQPVSNSWTE